MKESIKDDLKRSYGIVPINITQVMGGLLNLKWKVSTEKGDFLVKQYSIERFNRERIEKIEIVLRRQVILYRKGVRCPFLLQRDGRIIRWLDDETAYMVMEFCSGVIEKSETITVSQMRSLGSVCGVMHRDFAELEEAENMSGEAMVGNSISSLKMEFDSRISKCSGDTRAEYREALNKVRGILDDVKDEFLERLPKGLAHEDFHSGNILFNEGGVSAVVDFDRNRYSYIWHDVGRAILSFALENGVLNMEKIRGFLRGYSEYLNLRMKDIADALKITWCIEICWWMHERFFRECDEIPKRFKEEILWLTENWWDIGGLLE